MKQPVSIIFAFTVLILLLPMIAAATAAPPVVEDCMGLSEDTGVPIPCPGIFSSGLGPAGRMTASGVIMDLILIALWITGTLSVLFVIIGGIRYVTAHGNEEQAEAAKKTILHAIIGVVIVVLSFVIVRVITNALILGSFGA